ncbi:hypothetical protein MAR_037344 [Mya arenaria]|uniref:Uncharacterized protein n=1 Tax=Mya arenaria TaxID=6604 RepID=A0ABY7FN94_MYAAR|nr:hypothetical protein MAR_037344 [Mya arenaria]
MTTGAVLECTGRSPVQPGQQWNVKYNRDSNETLSEMTRSLNINDDIVLRHNLESNASTCIDPLVHLYTHVLQNQLTTAHL